jgi:hypothetical protein
MGLGKTAKFYRSNPASAQKHSDTNNSGKGGKFAHTKEYKRKHAQARKRLKPGPGNDASTGPNGKMTIKNSGDNRAANGQGNNPRYA